jgi:hypothetical protein
MTTVLFYRSTGTEAETAKVITDVSPDLIDLQIINTAEQFNSVPRYKVAYNKNKSRKKQIYPFFRDLTDQALGFNSILK